MLVSVSNGSTPPSNIFYPLFPVFKLLPPKNMRGKVRPPINLHTTFKISKDKSPSYTKLNFCVEINEQIALEIPNSCYNYKIATLY